MPHPPHDHAHHHDAAGHHGAGHGVDGGLDDLLDLEGVVLSDYWADAIAWVLGSFGESPRLVVDLGAGTGTGSIGFAARLPASAVIAVDVSADALSRIEAKARQQGMADRVRTLQADLDEGWPEVGVVDLAWASMSLHHLGEPDRTLREVLAATRPGGAIAVAEFSEPVRFLPAVGGRIDPGFEDRLMAAWHRSHDAEMPTIGADWSQTLDAAGWQVVEARDFAIDLDPPTGPAAAAYARGWFARLSDGLADDLTPDDRATLQALTTEDLPLSDLHVRGIRTVTLARRE